jgi:hypothetical protein
LPIAYGCFFLSLAANLTRATPARKHFGQQIHSAKPLGRAKAAERSRSKTDA